jgi:hypothetical protein
MFYRRIYILSIFLIVYLFMGGHVLYSNNEPVEYPSEAVQLHSDRDIFISGEHLHFKTWLLSDVEDPNHKSGIIYLILRNHAGIVQNLSLQLENNRADGNLYLHDTLSTGFYELVAFTNWMRNAGEKSYSRKSIFIANRFDRNLEKFQNPASNHSVSGKGENYRDNILNTDHEVDNSRIIISGISNLIGKREKVQFHLDLKDHVDSNVNVSISVVSTGSLAEFNGSFDAGKMQSGTLKIVGDIPGYYMEPDEMIISGVVTLEETGKAVEGARVILNTPADRVNILYTYTGKNGVFHFPLPAGYMGRDLFLSVDPASQEGSFKIEIKNKYDLVDTIELPYRSLSAGQTEYIRKIQDVARARIAFDADFMVLQDKPVLTKSRLTEAYSDPVQVFHLAEFTSFDDLQEIAREIVPVWRIRQSQNVFRSRLINATTGSFLPDEPVYFIDGIICHDLNVLTHLNSEMIDRIELQNLQWVHGDLEFQGIIAIFTKNNEYLRILDELTVFHSSQNFYHKEKFFQMPEYSSQSIPDPERPDLRQLLFWEPDLNLGQGEGAELGFYTGDIGGDYSIVITGITDSGEIVELVHSFIVK